MKKKLHLPKVRTASTISDVHGCSSLMVYLLFEWNWMQTHVLPFISKGVRVHRPLHSTQ